MKDGQFVESGDVQQIVDHPATEYTRALLAAVPVLGPWDETPTESGSGSRGAHASQPSAGRPTDPATDSALTQTGASHD